MLGNGGDVHMMQMQRCHEFRGRVHRNLQLRGLPEGNFETILKNSESTYITEFCGLYNGIIRMDVR